MSTKVLPSEVVLPSDKKIRKQMEKLVPTIDINSMSVKLFIKLLSKTLGVNLKEKKKFIKENLTAILDEMGDGEEEVEEEIEVEVEETLVKTKGKGSGLNKPCELSPELGQFLGKSHESRPQVVKQLWAYFKENNLQNPKDKRVIILDDTLKAIFNVDQFTMFQLGKYIGAHIHPFKPVNLNEMSANSKKKKEDSMKRKAEQAKNGVAKKRKAGTQPPYHLSEQMIKITGKKILPRPQVTQALWAYIKANDLQNPDDKREIFCDDLLKSVMAGKAKVTMFNMNKYIGAHILELADRDEYARQKNMDGDSDEESIPEKASKGRARAQKNDRVRVKDQVSSDEEEDASDDGWC